MPRRLQGDMSHSLASKTTTQQYRQCNIKPCIFKGYVFSGVFIIRRITMQRHSIHLRLQTLLADEHCSSSSIAINSASFVKKYFLDNFANRVAVLIHRDHSSAGAGDSLLRLQWKRTPLCLFETDVTFNQNNSGFAVSFCSPGHSLSCLGSQTRRSWADLILQHDWYMNN